MDVRDKLNILAAAAKYDVSCSSSGLVDQSQEVHFAFAFGGKTAPAVASGNENQFANGARSFGNFLTAKIIVSAVFAQNALFHFS